MWAFPSSSSAALWRYYPQMLELEADLTAGWMLDL
jgi:hypothetical protein